MSSSWIYIDASGRVDARSWPQDKLHEAHQHVSPRLLEAGADEVRAYFNRPLARNVTSVTFRTARAWTPKPKQYAGKLLLVPSSVAEALVRARLESDGAPRGFLTPAEFRQQYQGEWPAHEPERKPKRYCQRCDKPLPRGCCHDPACVEAPIACGDEASCSVCSLPKPCARCGLVAGCACDRGA